jgi:hypothetical protein
MTLNGFLKTEKQVSLKGILKTLRRKWRRGPYSKFDELLSHLAKCDIETASRIRESWEDLELLAYDSGGFLVWYNGWLKSAQSNSLCNLPRKEVS